jgi:mRNA interferase RelE/StbE
MPAYRVLLTPAADRQLARLPRQAREMVAAAIVTLASNPQPPGSAKLAGAGDLWRIRVRDYRVVYTVRSGELVVTVVKIGNRKEVYR